MAKPSTERQSFFTGWKRMARLYSKSKIGMIGLVIIVFYVLLAVFAPNWPPSTR